MSKDKLVILVHGFRVKDNGDGTVNRLKPFFEVVGCDVKTFSYGFTFFLSTRFFNEEIAEDLAKLIKGKMDHYKDIIVVGHSNGCTIAHLASYKLPVEASIRYVYVNPALEKHLVPSPRVASIDVWHNKKDKAVLLSKLLFWRAKERPWGKMGNVGYQGDDPRFTNYDTLEDFSTPCAGHSTIFQDKELAFYGPRIVQKVMRKL